MKNCLICQDNILTANYFVFECYKYYEHYYCNYCFNNWYKNKTNNMCIICRVPKFEVYILENDELIHPKYIQKTLDEYEYSTQQLLEKIDYLTYTNNKLIKRHIKDIMLINEIYEYITLLIFIVLIIFICSLMIISKLNAK